MWVWVCETVSLHNIKVLQICFCMKKYLFLLNIVGDLYITNSEVPDQPPLAAEADGKENTAWSVYVLPYRQTGGPHFEGGVWLVARIICEWLVVLGDCPGNVNGLMGRVPHP